MIYPELLPPLPVTLEEAHGEIRYLQEQVYIARTSAVQHVEQREMDRRAAKEIVVELPRTWATEFPAQKIAVNRSLEELRARTLRARQIEKVKAAHNKLSRKEGQKKTQAPKKET